MTSPADVELELSFDQPAIGAPQHLSELPERRATLYGAVHGLEIPADDLGEIP